MTPEAPTLAELVEDAKHMPLSMLPRPRAQSPDPARTIDLTAHEITIPEATLLLVDGLEDY